MTEQNTSKRCFTTKDMVLTALFTAITAVCAWISIPFGAISFTMQIFAVFCCLLTIGGKNGFFSLLAYILLGAIGLPVFNGFKGGVGILLGPTGGYIWGFIFIALIYWIGTKLFGEKLLVRIALLIVGLLACYAFGTLWFVYGYSNGESVMSLKKAAEICVYPFVPFDLLKMVLAFIISYRIKKHVKIKNYTGS
ncbi:biotin transporter BioY [Ruminococcus sp.]|uniref:biotin transporter BioY n=1 Tax=Ruminococcus sp. TaxID=41978 RepID=UPI0025DE1D97|nr:biotin transporter BioY [Ruminococcus sp.]